MIAMSFLQTVHVFLGSVRRHAALRFYSISVLRAHPSPCGVRRRTNTQWLRPAANSRTAAPLPTFYAALRPYEQKAAICSSSLVSEMDSIGELSLLHQIFEKGATYADAWCRALQRGLRCGLELPIIMTAGCSE
jgi:hypothetical protein